MRTTACTWLLLCASLTAANPAAWPRTVSALNAAATAEAQPRDDTATRAFSNAQIKVRLLHPPRPHAHAPPPSSRPAR